VKDIFCYLGDELPEVSTDMYVFLQNAVDQDLKSNVSSLMDIFTLKHSRELY
jgi:hypothetical protein